MSKLISREHDKFSGVTKTSTENFSWGGGLYPLFSLHHFSKPEGEMLSLELRNVKRGPDYEDHDLDLYMYLDYGELILNINHTQNIVLKPIDINRTRTRRAYISDYHYDYEEIASYSLTKEQLQMLCSAESVEYKLTGNGSSIVYEEQPQRNNDNLGRMSIYFRKDGVFVELKAPFQLYAKALYNAIYEPSLYLQELDKMDKQILEEQNRQISAKKEEKIAREKAIAEDRKKTTNNFLSYVGGFILCFIGLPLALWGGFTTLGGADNGSLIWIGLCTFVLGIVLIFRGVNN